MVTTAPSAVLIPVFPLLAFAVNILFGRLLGKRAAWVSVGASLVACAFALPLAARVALGGSFAGSFEWITLAGKPFFFGYLLDPLAAAMLFVVAIVGTLIQIYSMGYMHDDPRYSRFFAYLSLFMFAMLTLVISDNFLLFFMSWEIMGLCSYLLIGFYFQKLSAADACKKAFLTTRVGDIGFFLGIMTLFVITGALDFAGLGEAVHHHHGHALIPWAAFLIFCGTIGKSAQLPLHVWLPDAMEGPTPVSALIHAATMVAAGVFLVARSFPLFEAAPHILYFVACTGTVTALVSAFIALTATDIKKILAYSTISQLGFMVAALGLGNLPAGMFHLVTHAYFKGLLFLGAGSIIHGTGTQDIRELGGLFGKMKSTAWTFLLASLAIAGVPPLAGFWSKDEILVAAHGSPHAWIYAALSLAAFMTAFYMFRLVFLTFFGKARNEKIHAHESPLSMTGPLWILAGGAVLLGLPGSPLRGFWLQKFLLRDAVHHTAGHHAIHPGVMLSSTVIGLCGIALAAFLYLGGLQRGEKLAQVFRPFYIISTRKFWFDEIYGFLLVRPFHWLGTVLYTFDQVMIDGIVNGAAWLTVIVSRIHGWFDAVVVDGLVNFTGAFTRFWSAVLRRLQTGLVQHYLLIMLAGIVVFLFMELK